MKYTLHLLKEASITPLGKAEHLVSKDGRLVFEKCTMLVGGMHFGNVVWYGRKETSESFEGLAWRNFIDGIKVILNSPHFVFSAAQHLDEAKARHQAFQLLEKLKVPDQLIDNVELKYFRGILALAKDFNKSRFKLSDNFNYILNKCLELLDYVGNDYVLVVF